MSITILDDAGNMRVAKKIYVNFLPPGATVPSVQEVSSRNVENLEIPQDVYAFNFHDILSITIEVDRKIIELKSEPQNISPTHYYGGEIFNIEEIETKFPQHESLPRMMKSNCLDRLIRTKKGFFKPFYKDDVLIEMK